MGEWVGRRWMGCAGLWAATGREAQPGAQSRLAAACSWLTQQPSPLLLPPSPKLTDDPGLVLRNTTGSFSGQLSVDTSVLTPGWHKLTLQGKAIDPATGATNTGSMAVQMEVVTGIPAACGVPVQTHATADSVLSTTITTVVQRAGALPRVTVTSKSASGATLQLKPPATTTTALTAGGTRTVATASFARLSYRLSWLAPATPLSAASVWLYVRSGPAGATLVALDGDVLDPATGLPSAAARIGQGTMPAAGAWVEVQLDAAKVAAKLAAGKPLNLALTLEAGATFPNILAASASKGPPPLLLTPAC